MKSSQPNTSEQPPAMSVSNSRDNTCLGHDSNAAAVAFLTDDGISYLLPYRAVLVWLKEWPTRPWKRDRRHRRKNVHPFLDVPSVVVLGSGLITAGRDWLQKKRIEFCNVGGQAPGSGSRI